MAIQSFIEGLRSLEPELRAKGLSSLYLFGSTARGESRPDSDVDLFCDLDPSSTLGFGFFALADRIAEALGRPVDLTTRDGLHPLIRDEVMRDAVRVF
jgi:predicted nucleotidyltransferase